MTHVQQGLSQPPDEDQSSSCRHRESLKRIWRRIQKYEDEGSTWIVGYGDYWRLPSQVEKNRLYAQRHEKRLWMQSNKIATTWESAHVQTPCKGMVMEMVPSWKDILGIHWNCQHARSPSMRIHFHLQHILWFHVISVTIALWFDSTSSLRQWLDTESLSVYPCCIATS